MQMSQHDDRIGGNPVSVWQSSQQVTPVCRFSHPVGTVLSQEYCVAFISALTAFIKLYSQNWLKSCIQYHEDFRRTGFTPYSHRSHAFQIVCF